MAESYHELEGLRVEVDRVVYAPQLQAPPDKPYPFVYFLTIRNGSAQRVVILRRKWIVREEGGETTVLEGERVVGQTPELGPGQHFSYNSYHVTANGGIAHGAFFGETASGQKIVVRIPEFELALPPETN